MVLEFPALVRSSEERCSVGYKVVKPLILNNPVEQLSKKKKKKKNLIIWRNLYQILGYMQLGLNLQPQIILTDSTRYISFIKSTIKSPFKLSAKEHQTILNGNREIILIMLIASAY